MSDARRDLPAVHVLLGLVPDLPHAGARDAARAAIADARLNGPPLDWAQAVRARYAAASAPHLRWVLNATGVVLHTNLGRAPLSPRAAAAVSQLAAGYTNLELDLRTGARGERLAGITPRLTQLFGAEAALAVNNCAAAVLLALSALAAGREVLVSRGELVEIGGSFRIPEVITACGGRLVEVGSTNRTRVEDYARAITPDTAVILRVHPSNFHMAGFVEAPDRDALIALARERGVLYVDDLGSGSRVPRGADPGIGGIVRAGADVVCFSGDKLFGGPQAGILLGRAEPIARMRRHPLYRALRLDRLVLAALEATLLDVATGAELPVDAMLNHTPDTLRERTQAVCNAIGGGARVVTCVGLPGGGSLPEARLDGLAVRLDGPADALARALRHGDVPVIARIEQDAVLLDLRTVLPDEDAVLVAAVRAARSA